MELDLFLRTLEARFDVERRSDEDALVGELADVERAGLSLTPRLAAREGEDVTLVLRGGDRVSGRLVDAAATWVLVREEYGDSLVPVRAIVSARPLASAEADSSSLRRGIGFGHALRGLVERGADVVVDHDGGRYEGVLVAAFADHVEMRLGVKSVDSRDRGRGEIVGLMLEGIRRIALVGERY